ncbi:hypothetical protein C0J52_10083 [Blattella germanica]|nr:hypothetical protein C0J52_10083 [Blattella germanica]
MYKSLDIVISDRNYATLHFERPNARSIDWSLCLRRYLFRLILDDVFRYSSAIKLIPAQILEPSLLHHLTLHGSIDNNLSNTSLFVLLIALGAMILVAESKPYYPGYPWYPSPHPPLNGLLGILSLDLLV